MTNREVSYTVLSMTTPTHFTDSAGRTVSPDTADELKQDIVQVGQGAYRAVFDLGEHVMKFARCESGRRSNRNEVALWEKHKGSNKAEMLCPIRAADPDGQWVIMDKAQPALPQEDAYANPDYIWEYDYSETTCEAEDFCMEVESAFGLVDVHEGNVGWLRGRLVALDYAD